MTEPLGKRAVFGIYAGGRDASGEERQRLEDFQAAEVRYGHKFAHANFYLDWDPSTPTIQEALGARLALCAKGTGRTLTLSWYPDVSTKDAAAGKRDAYLDKFADSCKQHAAPMFIRLMPEMNGSWQDYNGDPANFIKAWRRVVDRFRGRGATNVAFEWVCNNGDVPRSAANRLELYWPGREFVDSAGWDGYNWGGSGSDGQTETWQSWEQVHQEVYGRVAALDPTVPLMIGECGCHEPAKAYTSPGGDNKMAADRGHDKAAWVLGMFASTAFPRLQRVMLFDINHLRDWRLDSSPRAKVAYVAGLAGTAAPAPTPTPPPAPTPPTPPTPTPPKPRPRRPDRDRDHDRHRRRRQP